MARQDPQPLIRRGQVPQPPKRNRLLRPDQEGALEDIRLWRRDVDDYLDKLVSALENVRQPFAPKAEVGIAVDQATTTALAAVAWEASEYDNGGWWTVGAATRLTAPLSGVMTGVFQTKLAGSGTVRVELNLNGATANRGMDVTLNGDFTIAFPWQIYMAQSDYLEVLVSTGSSRDLVADWTKASIAHIDFLEEV